MRLAACRRDNVSITASHGRGSAPDTEPRASASGLRMLENSPRQATCGDGFGEKRPLCYTPLMPLLPEWRRSLMGACALATVLATGLTAQEPVRPAASPQQQPQGQSNDETLKRVDDLLWYQKLGDIADVDKVEYTSLPAQHVANPKAPGATNPLIVHAYTFIPKKVD
jgi:hypothetical protein